MTKIELLIKNYARFASLPWERNLSGAQKVWFIVYDPIDERRIRARLGEFELETRKADHRWKVLDLTQIFASWMSSQEYRDSYFETPDLLDMALEDLKMEAANTIRSALTQPDSTEDTVVAVTGIASLFGFCRTSDVISRVEADIRGRLVVFFPGEYHDSNYRLLDARDGWNYMAIPIAAHEGDLR